MIILTLNELDYLHNLDYHVENSSRTASIISQILNNKNKYELLLAKELKYSNSVKELVYKVHDQDYVNFLFNKVKNIKSVEFLDPDTYITKYTLDVIFTNLELLFVMADRIVKNGGYGYAYIRPPGHHAEYSKAMGFCIINNVAVLARYLQFYHNLKKIMIVDFDAHHGNGTQDIFYQDDTVLYFSTHAYPFYPFTGLSTEKGMGKGLGYNYNFPVSIYAGDNELIQIYQNEFVSIYDEFSPDFVIVSSGYDIHFRDPITYMSCSTDGINKIKEIILKKADYRNLIFVLEGGYNIDVLKEVVLFDIN